MISPSSRCKIIKSGIFKESSYLKKKQYFGWHQHLVEHYFVSSIRKDDDRWHRQLNLGSMLTIISLLCLPIAFCTIYWNNGRGHQPSFAKLVLWNWYHENAGVYDCQYICHVWWASFCFVSRTVAIPMGTNCAPLFADLLLYFCMADPYRDF